MTVETFFANFGHLADAPNGLQKLRELILQLAVQGKLVPQNPSDEPAWVLLKRIREHKEGVVKAGNIKKAKPTAKIKPTEEPFSLPMGWLFSRFGEITICRDGERVPLSRAVRSTRQGTYDYYGASGVIDKVDGYLFNKPLLLIGEDGANLINRSTPIAFIAEGKYWVNNHAHVLDGINFEFLKYMELFINAIDLKPYVTGTAQPKMNQAKMNSIVVALPPLEEQKRIVAKVDQLMALCDGLEVRQQKQQQGRELLNNAALNALLTAEPDEFADHWQRISTNFDLLYDHPETIAKLRAAILQLAVQGKLVPQDPNDEPASALLESLAKERELLVKQKKIKKTKPPVDFQGLDELRIKLPGSWSWVRLSEVADVVRGGSPRPAGDPRFYNGDIPFLKVADVSRAPGKMIAGFNATIKEAGLKKTRFIDKRTVLFTNSGATLGIPAICDFPATFNDGIAAFVELSAFVFDEYLYLYLKSLSQWFMEVASRGQGQPNLNTDIIKSTWFPLPSLEEQKRVVARVDQLMALCDELEAKLNQAQQHSEKLMEATVRQLLVA